MVWNEAQVRERAVVGEDCILGKGVYIDRDVVVGDRVKIENRASLFKGVTVEDGVFIGPHVCFTNDKFPRAVGPSGALLTDGEFEIVPTLVRSGASIGAGAVIVAGVTVGCWAMVGAGSVVIKDVPDFGLVVGQPAQFRGWVCMCGRPLISADTPESWKCGHCGRLYAMSDGESLSKCTEVPR
jgi:acetyltransferase-like isoleucine patch superfamily enzyme